MDNLHISLKKKTPFQTSREVVLSIQSKNEEKGEICLDKVNGEINQVYNGHIFRRFGLPLLSAWAKALTPLHSSAGSGLTQFSYKLGYLEKIWTEKGYNI